MSWSTYANRGNTLEEIIRLSNQRYELNGIAKIDKIAVPSTITSSKGEQKGFFTAKSTVDYTGLIHGGNFIAFDCKETKETHFPLHNISEHQVNYLNIVSQLGGHGFLILNFTTLNKYYRVDINIIKQYWDSWLSNRGKKGFASIPLESLTKYEVKSEDGYILHYLRGFY